MSPSESAPKQACFQVVKFTSLLRGDQEDMEKLLSSCEKDGFFYLDLRDWESGAMLQRLDSANKLMKNWFDQPLESKLATETLSDAHGWEKIPKLEFVKVPNFSSYKPPGVQSGVTENSRDGFEALRISRTGLLTRSHLPSIVLENIDLFEKYQLAAHYVLMTLLERLSDAIGLQGRDRYETYHPEGMPSKSTLFFLHHPVTEKLQDQTGRGHNAHTDVGSFTLLFTEQPGLQVLSPVTSKWEDVHAKPGHAIINVADTLRFISKKRFRSAMHRVLPPGGKMSQDRYSTAYFLRAGDSVTLQGIDGGQITAEEWFLRKYQSFNETMQEQRMNSIATGGMERDLGVAI